LAQVNGSTAVGRMARRLRRQTKTRLLIALLAALGLIPGCAGAVKDPSPTTLRVVMTDDWVTAPFLDAVRDFERKRENVRVVVDKQPIRGMLDSVHAAVDKGAPPDVVQAHAFAAAARNLAQPLDDLWAKQLRVEDFFPGALDDVTWAASRYGVPLDTNALVLLYNVDRLKEAGVEFPAAPLSFSEFETMARALSSPDGSRRALALGSSTWQISGWVTANGGALVQVGADGKPEFRLDSPETVQALEFLAGLVRQGLAFPPRAAETHSTDIFALFESGITSVLTTGTWDVAKLQTSRPAGSYRAGLMPTGVAGATRGSAMGGSSLFVPRGSVHRKLAFEFMVHVTSDRYAIRFAKEQGRLPTRRSLYEDPFFQNPNIQVVLEQLKTARPERLDAFPDAGRAFAKALDQVLREQKDPAVALGQAQREARASLGPS
jgi:multiple sugar transport system substrate-binding protein